MAVSIEQIERWIRESEHEHLEFKAAQIQYSFDNLARYCCAFANEGGGIVLLGVSDSSPRRIVGTSAFANLTKVKRDLMETLHIRIDVDEVSHRDGRVLVFQVPRVPGTLISYKDTYWMRVGESLRPMDISTLRDRLVNNSLDFSEEICPGLRLDGLSSDAIRAFRSAWSRRSSNARLQSLDDSQFLHDVSLLTNGCVTYAALILLGTEESLREHLAQSEVIWEYRNSEASIRHQQRAEFRAGFLLFHDQVWDLINRYNQVHHYQEGLIMWKIPTFNEAAVREAILNAICHRDYRRSAPVFLRQYPNKLIVESPGGFPAGITAENILWRQEPRNRRLAEMLTRSGFVERSGQGGRHDVRAVYSRREATTRLYRHG